EHLRQAQVAALNQPANRKRLIRRHAVDQDGVDRRSRYFTGVIVAAEMHDDPDKFIGLGIEGRPDYLNAGLCIRVSAVAVALAVKRESGVRWILHADTSRTGTTR